MPFIIKITQLRLERNYGEAVRLLQARLAQFHFDSEYDKAVIRWRLLSCSALLAIRLAQRLPLNRRAIHSSSSTEINQTTRSLRQMLSQAYAAMGEKDSALKVAERAIMLLPRAKDAVNGPGYEENLALIQTIFGENSRAISTLTQLLQTPYIAGFTAQRPLRRPFLGSIRSGTLCAPIPLSKNSARKSSREHTNQEFVAKCGAEIPADAPEGRLPRLPS